MKKLLFIALLCLFAAAAAGCVEDTKPAQSPSPAAPTQKQADFPYPR